MFVYKSFGIGIHSEIPLPELTAAAVQRDVLIRLKREDDEFPERPSPDTYSSLTPQGVCFWWEEAGTFLVRDSEIIVQARPDADQMLISDYVVNDTMAALLHQRGLLVLHASAVEIDSEAVVFMGDSGLGKSTTAALLQKRGHRLLSDDVVALDMNGPTPLVMPAYPQTKLWPEALEAVGFNVDALPVAASYTEKRIHRSDAGFQHSVVPLKVIYALGEGAAHGIEPLSPQAALVEVLNDFFVNTLNYLYLQVPEMISARFKQCSDLAKSVPIRRLNRRFDLADLSSLADMIEQDAAVLR